VLLLSKAYQSSDSRNRTQKKVEAGEYKLEPAKWDKEFGYQLLNKNQQVIAVGPAFSRKKDRDDALKAVAAAIQAPTRKKKVARKPATTAQKSKPEQAKAIAKSEGARHSFRLVYYQGSEHGKWQGQLSHSLTNDKISLQGIELEAIEQFLRRHLKKEEEPALVDVPGTLPADTPPPLAISRDGKELQNPIFSVGEPVMIKWPVDEVLADLDFEAEVYAKSLNSGDQKVVAQLSGHIDEAAELEMPIETNDLAAGIYRITARMDAKGNRKSKKAAERSCLLYLT
jgi:hypothetical protein